MRRALPALAALPLASALAALVGCGGGPPRHPGDGEGGAAPAGAARTPSREEAPPAPAPDPWSVDALLPRSGDPARPNCKVEVVTLDVTSSRRLAVRATVAGAAVRGVVDVRAALGADARAARARTRASTFVVVQAGREGLVELTDEARAWCGLGPTQALWVRVVRAGPDGVEVEVAPVAPTTRPGERVALATRVALRPGEAVLLGGLRQEASSESRTFGGRAEADARREVVVLLTVDVLG